MNTVVKDCLDAIVSSVEKNMGLGDRLEMGLCDQVNYKLVTDYRSNIVKKERGIILDEEGSLPLEMCCEVCGYSNRMIMSRESGALANDRLLIDCGNDMTKEERIICCSCSYVEEDSKVCIDCGISDGYCSRLFSDYQFIECNDGHRCEHCMDILSESNQLTFGPDDDTLSDIELTDSETEYEPGELPENNSEKVVKIKQSIQKVGEKMFDIQEKITEGEYLELMNLLMNVTRGVNEL